MALPLPRVVPDVGPGGPLITAMGGMNALQKQMLENQYYAPNIQSEINQRNALTQGQNITNQYLPDKLRLANALAGLQNQYYAPNIQSEINQRNALTSKYNTMTPLEAEELRLKNQWYPQTTQAQIESQKAMANMRNMGGGRAGVGLQEFNAFKNQLANDNPNFTPEQLNQAASAYLEGSTELPNGEKLPPLSGYGQQIMAQILKRGTTSALVTGNVRANQAEAELGILNDYAQKGLEPYGDTFLNMSPQQIVDSFKSDDKSQDKLGKLVASQALQYETAQNRIRVANGQPGVTSTQELMKMSGQLVDLKFPFLSYRARKEAARYMDEALKAGLKARNSVRITASSLQPKKSSNKSSNIKPTLRYNLETGDYEEIKQ